MTSEEHIKSPVLGSTLEDREKETGQNVTILDPAPDGGVRAWLVAVGSFCVTFCCLGMANSFGVFQEYYMSHQLKDRQVSDVAWIGSLSTLLPLLIGAISGPLTDRYGTSMMVPATVAYVLAIMMTSLCTQLWQFMLAQGLLAGLAQGFIQTPAITAVLQYFDKKRAAAMGICISGSSVGGVVFPIVLSTMLNDSNLGFGWSVRIMAFVALPFLAFACLTIKSRTTKKDVTFYAGEAVKNERFLLIIAAFFFAVIGLFTPLFFLPTYAVSQGIDSTLASYLLAIVNGASTFGRIIPGILADKYGKLNTLAIGSAVTGIIICCLNEVHGTGGFVVYSVMVGFWSGTILSGAAAAISTCASDPRLVGSYVGPGMALASFGTLIGPQVTGAMVDKYHNFFPPALFSGLSCIVGAVIVLMAKVRSPDGLLALN